MHQRSQKLAAKQSRCFGASPDGDHRLGTASQVVLALVSHRRHRGRSGPGPVFRLRLPAAVGHARQGQGHRGPPCPGAPGPAQRGRPRNLSLRPRRFQRLPSQERDAAPEATFGAAAFRVARPLRPRRRRAGGAGRRHVHATRQPLPRHVLPAARRGHGPGRGSGWPRRRQAPAHALAPGGGGLRLGRAAGPRRPRGRRAAAAAVCAPPGLRVGPRTRPRLPRTAPARRGGRRTPDWVSRLLPGPRRRQAPVGLRRPRRRQAGRVPLRPASRPAAAGAERRGRGHSRQCRGRGGPRPAPPARLRRDPGAGGQGGPALRLHPDRPGAAHACFAGRSAAIDAEGPARRQRG